MMHFLSTLGVLGNRPYNLDVWSVTEIYRVPQIRREL